MKLAYLKTNHCVNELQRVCGNPDKVLEGGPDAYVSSFVRLTQNFPGLLLSVHFDPEEDAVVRQCNIEARSFYWQSRRLKRFGEIAQRPIGTLITRLVTSVRIFYLLVRFQPSHLLCWAHSFPLWAAFLASRFCRSRFVYCRHTRILGYREPFYLRVTNGIDRWIMRRADAVVVHGPYLRQQLLDVGVDPKKLFEYSWSFRHLFESPGDGAPDISERNTSTVILFVGRVQESKGVFDLLEACAPRLKGNTNVKLVYAGDGTDLAKLRERAAELGLYQRVQFIGMIPHPMLAGVIQQCSIVVTPTRSVFPEGRCMATIEGVLMGKPVVAPNCGPFPYTVVHEHNGLLFEPDSVEDLRRSIERLLDDQSLYERLCHGARERGPKLSNPDADFLDAVKAALAIGNEPPPAFC